MARGEARFRIPLRARILLASLGVHGVLAVVLLATGPLVPGRLPSSAVPVSRVDLATTIPLIPEDELEDDLPPVLETDLPSDPEPDDLAREDVPVQEQPRAIAVRLGTPTLGSGPIRMRSLRGIGPRRRPSRLRPERVERTAPKVVARNGVRFALADLSDDKVTALEIRVELDTSGKVTDVVVRRPSGVVSFDAAIVASVSQWQFRPATENGEAVTSFFDLTLTPARPRKTPAPAYPSRAIDRELEGVVRLAADLGADGRVEKVHVIESSGVPMLDKAAIEAVTGWEFGPARVNGHPTRCTVEIRPIRFRLID